MPQMKDDTHHIVQIALQTMSDCVRIVDIPPTSYGFWRCKGNVIRPPIHFLPCFWIAPDVSRCFLHQACIEAINDSLQLLLQIEYYLLAGFLKYIYTVFIVQRCLKMVYCPKHNNSILKYIMYL